MKDYIEVEDKRTLGQNKINGQTNSFVKAHFDVLKDIGHTCGGNAYMVYMALYMHQNHENAQCNPGISTLAKETGLSPRSINDQLTKLVDAGYITYSSGGQSKDERRYTNDYFILTAETAVDLEQVSDNLPTPKRKSSMQNKYEKLYAKIDKFNEEYDIKYNNAKTKEEQDLIFHEFAIDIDDAVKNCGISLINLDKLIVEESTDTSKLIRHSINELKNKVA